MSPGDILCRRVTFAREGRRRWLSPLRGTGGSLPTRRRCATPSRRDACARARITVLPFTDDALTAIVMLTDHRHVALGVRARWTVDDVGRTSFLCFFSLRSALLLRHTLNSGPLSRSHV